MESKKINQLATELTPALSDLTIIGDPTTGISKKITLSQMASLFTGTVEEYANLAAFPLVGTADTIYIALDTNIIYRWNTGTSAYVELSPNIVTSLVFSDANGFDGTISLVGSTATLTITTALTTGSVPFIGASGALSQDNANLFFDDTNNRFGINTNAPTTALDVFGSGIIGRLNGTSTNNAFLGFASAGSNKWSIGNVQSDHRFRIYNEATTNELVSVLQTGEFGIGIANPTTKLHIDGGASALIANLDANVSVAKSISFRSDNSNRINLEVSGTESGSNAGANFFIRRYSDAGALIDTPLTITRSTGTATFSGTVQFGTTSGYTTASEGQFFSKGGGSIYIANILAAVSTLKAFVIQRNDSEKFSIGLNSSDSLAFINASGTAIANISSTGAANFSSTITAAALSRIGDVFIGGRSGTAYASYADGLFGDNLHLGATTAGGAVYINAALNRNLIINPVGGSVGIGTINPSKKLHIVDTAEQLRIGYDNTVYSDFRNDSSGGLLINTSSSYIIHYIGGSLKFRINSNGFIGNGPDSPLYNFDLTGNDNAGTSTYLRVFSNNRTVWTGIGYQRLETNGEMSIVSGSGTLFLNGGTERARINSAGYFKASNNGVYNSSTGAYHEFMQDSISTVGLRVIATNSGYYDAVQQTMCTRTNNSAYALHSFYSNNFADMEFNLRGDGNAYADASWNGGGADYAEFFEWIDGNPNNEDRRGYSVSLVDNKIKIAEKGEKIIGIISGNPSVIGDSAWNIWTEKYLRDDFGTYIRDENGDRILNPNYNPNIEYIPREQRPEWGIVGLMGKLCIRKGQEVMPTWVKMKDISNNVEQWLIK